MAFCNLFESLSVHLIYKVHALPNVFSCKTQKIDGFKILVLNIDGFDRTHQTHANGAPVYCNLSLEPPLGIAYSPLLL